MYRIAIVTSDIERDWASRELLSAAQALARGDVVDPISFEIRTDATPVVLAGGEPADAYDAYIVRALNAQGGIDYQYEVLELLENMGRLVINSTSSISLAESKSQTTSYLRKAGLPVPRTVTTQNLDQARAAVRAFGSAVVKPLYGSHGIGIERIESGADEGRLAAFLDRYGVVYIQEFIPNEGRDIRAFVVGDEILAAVYRIARKGGWKTNVYQGGSCEPCELSPEIREICLESAQVIGLDYTGVDVMEGPDGPVVLELNGAPSWCGLSEATNRDVALDVVSRVLQALDAGRPARRPSGSMSRRSVLATAAPCDMFGAIGKWL
jgi:RimK family alpha-L-glutamate ligase